MALQASAPGELRGALGRLGCRSAPEAQTGKGKWQSLSRRLTIACCLYPPEAADQPILDVHIQ